MSIMLIGCLTLVSGNFCVLSTETLEIFPCNPFFSKFENWFKFSSTSKVSDDPTL